MLWKRKHLWILIREMFEPIFSARNISLSDWAASKSRHAYEDASQTSISRGAIDGGSISRATHGLFVAPLGFPFSVIFSHGALLVLVFLWFSHRRKYQLQSEAVIFYLPPRQSSINYTSAHSCEKKSSYFEQNAQFYPSLPFLYKFFFLQTNFFQFNFTSLFSFNSNGKSIEWNKINWMNEFHILQSLGMFLTNFIIANV